MRVNAYCGKDKAKFKDGNSNFRPQSWNISISMPVWRKRSLDAVSRNAKLSSPRAYEPAMYGESLSRFVMPSASLTLMASLNSLEKKTKWCRLFRRWRNNSKQCMEFASLCYSARSVQRLGTLSWWFTSLSLEWLVLSWWSMTVSWVVGDGDGGSTGRQGGNRQLDAALSRTFCPPADGGHRPLRSGHVRAPARSSYHRTESPTSSWSSVVWSCLRSTTVDCRPPSCPCADLQQTAYTGQRWIN